MLNKSVVTNFDSKTLLNFRYFSFASFFHSSATFEARPSKHAFASQRHCPTKHAYFDPQLGIYFSSCSFGPLF